jgi:hypothetical protein
MQEYQEDFNETINQFIKYGQNNNNTDIKSVYLKLVKSFHPDLNKKIDNKLANEYMIIINYIYDQLINRNKIELKVTEKYEKDKTNGKYCFINDYGKKEYIKDKEEYMYKLGLWEYQRTRYIFGANDYETEKSGYEIIGHLYKCYKYCQETIKIDGDGMWGTAAKKLLEKAYILNERVTRGLNKSDSKELEKR